ncbi:hypothetical protein P2318_22650 [Myxococcaceae bacterium GXIMD 01537]
MALQNFDMDDIEKEMAKEAKRGKGLTDFDCPSCNANNPADPPISDGGEVMCHYCGSEFRASVSDGKVKLREV